MLQRAYIAYEVTVAGASMRDAEKVALKATLSLLADVVAAANAAANSYTITTLIILEGIG